MNSPDITALGLFFGFMLLILPLLLMWRARMTAMAGDSLRAIARMAIQLTLAGIFLTLLFEVNNPVFNLLWLLVMITVGAFEAVRRHGFALGLLFWPTFAAFAFTVTAILFYLNIFVIQLGALLFDAQFMIPIAGMLLGNALSSHIIGVGKYFSDLTRNEGRYLAHLSFGASKKEALLPYMQQGLTTALKPTLGNISTVGIVFLPGMMTGQILAGISPITAIKYQIVLMIAIYSSTAVSVTLAIKLLSRTAFDEYGILRKELLHTKKESEPKKVASHRKKNIE